MKPRIVLSHIPRTGGTSLFSAIKQQMPEARTAELDSYIEVALMRDSELNNFDLISTYIGSQLFSRLDESWTKLIVLRDPATRIISSYRNLRNGPEGISAASAIAKKLRLDDYLASRCSAVTVQATNVQTWVALGDKSIRFREKYAGYSSEAILDLAVKRLKEFDFIGFTENLDDLWRRICFNFKWEVSDLPLLRQNPQSHRNQLDSSTTEMDFHTRLDDQLIAHARKMELKQS